MKRIFLLYLTISGVFSMLAQEKMTDAQLTQFRDNVTKKAQLMKSLSADFEQRKHMDFLSNDIVTFGQIHYLKPDKLSWEYTKPYRYRTVFASDKIAVYDNGKVSEIKAEDKVFRKINNLITGSVNGNMFDEKEFSITYYLKDAKAMVTMLPKEKVLQRYIARIVLTFSDDGTVEKVKLVEPSADYTEILFKNKKINTHIDEKVFGK